MTSVTTARLTAVALPSLMSATGDLRLHVAPHGVLATPGIVIVPLAPRPDPPLAVSSPLAYIATNVTAPTAVRRLDLRLDGAPVTPAIAGRDATHQSVFYPPRRWTCGRHSVRLDIWDAAGAHAWRGWSFRLIAAP
jgi:hypothetical protein